MQIIYYIIVHLYLKYKLNSYNSLYYLIFLVLSILFLLPI
nr:MAG TPA: hypothetical protein [Bacteriophage sp.]